MTELSKQFDFRAIEDKWVKYWKENNLFHASADSKKPPYVITIPPPNVTGILHMGHALNNTLQDIIIRYKRMKGFETCWMPGTDHAGIATQNVVEKKIAKEGKTRHDVGREKFLEQVWDWKEHHGSAIIRQLESIGASCDWPRTRFTMDDKYSEAVKEVFVRLYEKGLIYKGEYIINWCPRCHTALSDEEAEHEEKQGSLTHIKYPLKDSDEFIVVATTRPETMLGDTAVAVNPKDERYQNVIGKTIILPLVNREIPIIADDFVDPKFGTGAVKVTPAHDPNDFAIGKRHDLPFINIMYEDGRINEQGGDYANLDRFEARKKVVESLKVSDLIVKVEDHNHAVGHCYRCHTVVEPHLSKQWFVKMEPLAKPAVKAVKEKKIRFHPARWEKTYMNWMENIRDWCISRQIWWGHRIPVWYDDQGNEYCARSENEAQEMAITKRGEHVAVMQDPDVLDTWFSSWLWPFATFGWPEENADTKFFYPGHALFTAPEIIFFWVARMIMAGYEFMGDLPFQDVYLHGTVRDAQGRKMSKSLGNALDPLEIVEEYGADALRFSLIINSGQDLFISKEKFEIGRNFANKVWNASRLVLMNVKNTSAETDFASITTDDLASQWIISKCHSTLKAVEEAIESYRYSEAESLIYEFVKGYYCDWYLEIIKDKWEEETIQNTAITILKMSLKMLSPFMPFVTEEIWKHIKASDQSSICVEPWPELNTNLITPKIEKNMDTIIHIISIIRNLRAEWNVKPKDKVDCTIMASNNSDRTLIEDNEDIIKRLARTSNIIIASEVKQIEQSASAIIDKIKITLPLGSLIDIDKEKKRINSQIDQLQKSVENIAKRLSNKGFLEKAPKDVVENDKVKCKDIEAKIKQLKAVAAELQ